MRSIRFPAAKNGSGPLKKLTEEQLSLLPDDGDVAFYRRHGYYISKEIIPEEMLDAAIFGTEQFYAGHPDHPPLPGADRGWCREDGQEVLRKNDHTSFQIDAIDALVHYPLLGAVAARLLGEPVRLWTDQLLYKPRDNGEVRANVGWHTDRQYWRCCTSEEMLTAWIPFRDVAARDGTLTVIDGSHLWPDNTFQLNFREQQFREQESLFHTGGSEVVTVPMALKRGQVSFHHCKTIHASGPNHGELPRMALAVHLQGKSNSWQPFDYVMPDGTVKKHDIETLVRKRNDSPDFADPTICPYLWPVPDPSDSTT